MAAPSVARSGSLNMLGTLERGAWTLRVRDEGRRQSICLRSGSEFIQLRHPRASCNRYVVKDTPDEVVVQYTCPGNDYGRTTIRRESPQLVQIQSQGIRDGRPFSFSGEARYDGRC